MFAQIDACIVKIPNFRALVFWIPLAEGVSKTEETFLCARLFFVSSRTADQTIKPKFLNRRQESRNLQTVAADFSRRRGGNSFSHRIFHRAHDELGAEFFRAPVAKFIELREMVACVHV